MSEMATREWTALGTGVTVACVDPAHLDLVGEIASSHVAMLDAACSRFRNDSELVLLPSGRPRYPNKHSSSQALVS